MAEKNCITYLIGNKIDLLENHENSREVSTEEAKKYAKENGLRFYETSALTSVRINDCFEDLLQEIYNERRRVRNTNKSIGSTKVLSLNNDNGNENKQCC